MFPNLPPADIDLGRDLAIAAPHAPMYGDTLPENPRIPAGFAFWGQWLANDITHDHSPLGAASLSDRRPNHRAPRLNLEGLYGQGSIAQPYLYDRDDPAKLLIGTNERGEALDVPRNVQGLALIGDPRNDSHLFISQLQLALLRMHNAVVDILCDQRVPEVHLLASAIRTMRWHYQWTLLHEYLPLLVGDSLTAAVLADEPLQWTRGEVFVPLEFTAGIFRVGHAQLRNDYTVNALLPNMPIFPELEGRRPVSGARTVAWEYVFDVPGECPPLPSAAIAEHYAQALMALPESITGPIEDPLHAALAYRDLRRGADLGLPSGEDVARELGETPLAREELGLPTGLCPDGTPLLYYLLREAWVCNGGRQLGPVGGRLVAEVLVTLVKLDPTSYLAVEPEWRPSLGRVAGEFGVVDMLDLAGLLGT